ncbi:MULTISPECIES: MFS transporter [unclassified Novosphingobium]|uniref:MFS transporter n=1 Tax=unclassified Novosphingobium TaxID=2644732 RepID=UPI00146AB3C2|nr:MULTISPECIES: MFS transporter [unclassified Novosphingobium]NMN04502.1 ACS family hexuronate transporter-like MFS transporter [Novosphingobium sp. SG919]NMN85506.1 ACS family hexuronate transporter-like MFS transporter [Novosphingobium sp. SG916]
MTALLSPRRRQLLFLLALTAGILNLVDRQIIAVLKPTIAADLHWTDDDYGTLAALFQAGAAFGFLAAGWLVDRLGVRRANAFGVAAWSLAAMAHGWARSFAGFMACRIGLGMTEAMGTPAGIKTMAAIFPPEQRSTGIGLSNAVNSIGAILAPLAIPLVAALWGWRAAFVVAGALGLVWALAWWLATRGVDFDDAPRIVAGDADPVPVWREARTWTIAGAKVLSDATWFLMLFWMPDYFHRAFGLAGTELGPPLALAYAGAALGSVLAGTVSSRWIGAGKPIDKVRKQMMLVSALVVVPVPLALLMPGAWGAAAVLALALAGHQGFSTSLFGLIADVTPRARVGRVTGFSAFCGNLGGTAITKIAGLTLAAGLGYGPLFAFAAVSYLLALGWISLTMPRIVPVENGEAGIALGH